MKNPIILNPVRPPTPATAYYCDNDKCSEIKSTNPHDLFWVAGWNGWYCIDCIANALESDEQLMIGNTVSEWFAKRKKSNSRTAP